jgi:flavin-dependent dehydrogenase
MKEILGDYTAEFGIGLENTKRHGHPVSVWNGKQVLHGRDCLLAGEAASLVDPFTAEGIRPSIFSGLSAGRAVHAALEGGKDALARYSETIYEELGKDFAWARRIAGLFYAFPKFAYERAIKSPHAFEFMGQLLSGQKRYRDEARGAVRALKAKLV